MLEYPRILTIKAQWDELTSLPNFTICDKEFVM